MLSSASTPSPASPASGVQDERDGGDGDGRLRDVTTTAGNSVPLTALVDGEHLVSRPRQLGIRACFVPHDRVVAPARAEAAAECGWLATLRRADDDAAFAVLTALRPNAALARVAAAAFAALRGRAAALHLDPGGGGRTTAAPRGGATTAGTPTAREVEEPARDRQPRGVREVAVLRRGRVARRHADRRAAAARGRGAVPARRGRAPGRRPAAGPRGWRRADAGEAAATSSRPRTSSRAAASPALSGTRRRRAPRRRAPSATGSAPHGTTPGAIPLLADFPRAQEIPAMYAHTEESQLPGRIRLEASIASVRRAFGRNEIDVHLPYHGTRGRAFLDWPTRRHAIVRPAVNSHLFLTPRRFPAMSDRKPNSQGVS